MIDIDWGEHGLRRLLEHADAVVVVDVLSFSTCVTVAVDRGTAVYPAATIRDGEILATKVEARLARPRSQASPGEISLSPASFRNAPLGNAVILPSPNGSALSAIASSVGGVEVYAGCLRNRTALAAIMRRHRWVGICAAGERWPDGSLRPAIEDWLGAGAILDAMEPSSMTAEASLARTAFRSAKDELGELIKDSIAGRELSAANYPSDAVVAAELDSSDRTPTLMRGAYRG